MSTTLVANTNRTDVAMCTTCDKGQCENLRKPNPLEMKSREEVMAYKLPSLVKRLEEEQNIGTQRTSTRTSDETYTNRASLM